MRVNIYAEEMTNRVEIVSKIVDGQEFTGLRIYLELPASFIHSSNTEPRAATVEDTEEAWQHQAPFIHRPGDDDSSAVTFWGKSDLRGLIGLMAVRLNDHYAKRRPRP